MDDKYELILINNPEYMGELSSKIEALVNKLNPEAITPQSLWRHFYQAVQRFNVQMYAGGSPTEELWAVFNSGEEVVAFAHWYVMGVPYNGTVFCDFIYSWNTSKKPTGMLVDKFIEFGKKHGCNWYKATATNDRVFTIFKKALEQRNLKVMKQKTINFIGRR